ncbi:MAG TPA: hypothetical protein VFP72_19380, partial [Kineosporiaceae bacterium]|nr:hypothetical protein [Kineosporiaceae bacterium]
MGITGRIPASTTRTFKVAGVGNVPSTGVAAVVLTITSVNASGASWVAAYATNSLAPGTTNLFTDSGPESNTSVVMINDTGTIDVVAGGISTDLIVDVAGYFSTGGGGQGFQPMTAVRAIDTRTGLGAPTAQVPPQGTVTFDLSALIPSDAIGVAINVTTINATTAGWFAVGAPGSSATGAIADYLGGTPSANMVFAPASQGKIELYNSSSVNSLDLAIDIQGYFMANIGAEGTFVFSAARIVDTRAASGGAAAIPAGATRTFTVGGKAGMPTAGVSAVAIILTAVSPGAGGYLRIWSAQDTEPDTSNVNFAAGSTQGNSAVIAVSTTASPTLTVRNSSSAEVHVLIDLEGWFLASPDGTVTQNIYRSVVGSDPVTALTTSGTDPSQNPAFVYDTTAEPTPTTSEAEERSMEASAARSYGVDAEKVSQDSTGATQLLSATAIDTAPLNASTTGLPESFTGGLDGTEPLDPSAPTDTAAGTADAAEYPADQIAQWDQSGASAMSANVSTALTTSALTAKTYVPPFDAADVKNCQSSAAARSRDGWGINHFRWCRSDAYWAEFRQSSWPYSVLGSVKFRLTLMGWALNKTRVVHYRALIDQVVTDRIGSTVQVTLTQRCLGSGYGYGCIAASGYSNSTSRPITQWKSAPSADFEWAPPKSSGT